MSLLGDPANRQENKLLLNPRLPNAIRARISETFREVTGGLRSHIGIVTSGSSGEMGKLILLSHHALETSAHAVNERLVSGPGDVWMKTLPDFHVGGLGIHIRASLSGARVVESRLEKWNAQEFYRELEKSQATLLSLVPTQLFDLVQLGVRAPSSLRAAVIGGGALNEDLKHAALQLGWPCLPSYGLTECCSQVATALSPHDSRLMPLSHVQVRVSETDHLLIKSESLLTSRIVFYPETGFELQNPKIDGWFETEDRARINQDGAVEFLGRSGDFVKISGEGVVVSRLEAALERLRIEAKLAFDVALLAADDERLGAKIVLLAASGLSHAPTQIPPEMYREGSTAERQENSAVETRFKALRQIVRDFNEQVMPYERIRDVLQVDEIPRSELGKLRRAQALALVGLKAPAHL